MNLSLCIYMEETYRLEKHLDIIANMDDTKQRSRFKRASILDTLTQIVQKTMMMQFILIKRKCLYVAIADVSYFVKRG